MSNFVAALWEALGKPQAAAGLRHFDRRRDLDELEGLRGALAAEEEHSAMLAQALDDTEARVRALEALMCTECRARAAE